MNQNAPGGPGAPATWSPSRKDMIGCALGPPRLWYTLGQGIVNEVYYPRVDIPQIRDLGFIVADDKGFWVEVKRHGDYVVQPCGAGAPVVTLTHHHPRFTLRIGICPDPRRDVLMLEVVLEGDSDLHPYVLLAPRLGGSGDRNEAWYERYRGRHVLCARQGPFALALAARSEDGEDGLMRGAAGYVGENDGWQDFARHGAMRWTHAQAGPGNVALTGALPRRAVLALGFGSGCRSAATLAFASLSHDYAHVVDHCCAQWETWHRVWQAQFPEVEALERPLFELLRTSAMVVKAHEDKTYPGAVVASLSIPWGETREREGGYHLVWPRDLVETAGALLALGAHDDARANLRYLIATQHADGHWHQNQWLGGRAYWTGQQLDETAFPVLLAGALDAHGALGDIQPRHMIRQALSYLALNGPVSDQDRWEEDCGLSPFTLAVMIAAMVAGADYLPPAERDLALELADSWNTQIEDWTVARDSELGQRHGIAAHYVRVGPRGMLQDRRALNEAIIVNNRDPQPGLKANGHISLDFLQLVRYGLRRADDPLVLDTLALADRLLKIETPHGPVWYRYNEDGYGEHDDGSPFDGIGRGRPWPLLAGERGHYEIAAGGDPLPLLRAMAASASPAGMLPEQIWDGRPLPECGLAPYAPTGSAMPLAWAHAEFIKLAAGRARGRPVDRPEAVWRRYRGERPASRIRFWTLAAPVGWIDAGCRLKLLLPRAAVLLWSLDDWQHAHKTTSAAALLGIHPVTPDWTAQSGQTLRFNLRWADGSPNTPEYRIVCG